MNSKPGLKSYPYRVVVARPIILTCENWVSEFARGNSKRWSKSKKWCAGCRKDSGWGDPCFKTICFELESDAVAFKMWYDQIPEELAGVTCFRSGRHEVIQ